MADNLETVAPTEADLEASANLLMDDDRSLSSLQSLEPVAPSVEGGEPKITLDTPTPAKPSGSVEVDEISKLINDLPYKGDNIVESVKKFVDGHKSLQSEFTKRNEKIKPFQEIIDRAVADQKYRDFLQQADNMYLHPELAQAYTTGGQLDQRPDLFQYDVNTAEGYARYNEALSAYEQRQLDARINLRLGSIEQRNQMEQQKFQFKTKFPTVQDDPDELMKWAFEDGKKMNPIEIAYKLKTYDSLKSQALEEARKELTKDLKTASSTATPAASAGGKQAITVEDILDHINRYGSESAKKKYGDANLKEALELSAGLL